MADCFIIYRWQHYAGSLVMPDGGAYRNLADAQRAADKLTRSDRSDCMYAIHNANSQDWSVELVSYVAQGRLFTDGVEDGS